MPKALCLSSLVASILVVVLFLADAVLGLLGMQDLAPMRAANLMMDIAFILVGSAMIFMSWRTFREQR
jgi:ABC-type nickel/cobalt efflux system permease component RcnA